MDCLYLNYGGSELLQNVRASDLIRYQHIYSWPNLLITELLSCHVSFSFSSLSYHFPLSAHNTMSLKTYISSLLLDTNDASVRSVIGVYLNTMISQFLFLRMGPSWL